MPSNRRKPVRQPVEFHIAFQSAKQVCDLIRRREEERKAKKQKENLVDRKDVFAAGKKLLNGINVRSNLRFVYQWKLRKFVRRFKWARDFPDGISDAVLKDAIQAARRAVKNPFDEEIVRDAFVGAAPCAPAVKREMIDWWGPMINEYYRATETGIVVWHNSAEALTKEARHRGPRGRRRDHAHRRRARPRREARRGW
jgi:hypothetical protein